MMPITLSEVAQAVGCTDSRFVNNTAKITSISTDSRPQPEDGDREGCLFVALRGENFDGHQYVGAAASPSGWWVSPEASEKPPQKR